MQIGLTDTQDLLTVLGEPDAVWRKREDKLRIHAAAEPADSPPSASEPGTHAVFVNSSPAVRAVAQVYSS